MPKLCHLQILLPSLSNKCNHIWTIALTQATFLHQGVTTIVFLAPMKYQSRFGWYELFTASNATDASSNHSYPLLCSMGLSTLRMMLGVYCSGYRCCTKHYAVGCYSMMQLWSLLSFSYWLEEVKIVEQWSQIVWKHQMGNIITLNVLRWLAGMICD